MCNFSLNQRDAFNRHLRSKSHFVKAQDYRPREDNARLVGQKRALGDNGGGDADDNGGDNGGDDGGNDGAGGGGDGGGSGGEDGGADVGDEIQARVDPVAYANRELSEHDGFLVADDEIDLDVAGGGAQGDDDDDNDDDDDGNRTQQNVDVRELDGIFDHVSPTPVRIELSSRSDEPVEVVALCELVTELQLSRGQQGALLNFLSANHGDLYPATPYLLQQAIRRIVDKQPLESVTIDEHDSRETVSLRSPIYAVGELLRACVARGEDPVLAPPGRRHYCQVSFFVVCRSPRSLTTDSGCSLSRAGAPSAATARRLDRRHRQRRL